jgi:hypothetical protein
MGKSLANGPSLYRVKKHEGIIGLSGAHDFAPEGQPRANIRVQRVAALGARQCDS